MVFIDTPLDVAMARRLIRDYATTAANDLPQAFEELERDLSGYLARARLPYLEMAKGVKPKSELVLDGCLTPEELAEAIIGQMTAEQGAATGVDPGRL